MCCRCDPCVDGTVSIAVGTDSKGTIPKYDATYSIKLVATSSEAHARLVCVSAA